MWPVKAALVGVEIAGVLHLAVGGVVFLEHRHAHVVEAELRGAEMVVATEGRCPGAAFALHRCHELPVGADVVGMDITS